MHIVICLICSLVAMGVSYVLIPQLVLLAYRKNLTDAPGYRKLQKSPVPILGGVSVIAGTIAATLFMKLWMNVYGLYAVSGCLITMFFIGLIDDLMDWRATLKFCLQIAVVVYLFHTGLKIDSLNGIFGVYHLPEFVSLLLSIVAGVGMVNAINMMDGSDGLSSGFAIASNFLCAIYFFLHGDYLFATFTFVFISALIPFFVINVFCRKYKMYIGDNGSLTIGIMAYIIICRIMQEPQMFIADKYKLSIAFAIFALPVIDTLRVMTMRIIHKRSPFMGDRTHLHHILVSMNVPHIVVAFIELMMALVIFLVSLVCSLDGIPVTWHFIITVLTSIIVTCGVYFLLHYMREHKPEQFEQLSVYVLKRMQWLVKLRVKTQNHLDCDKRRRRKKLRMS